MCEIGRRRDGAGCAEGCDARARAIGRDARACAACVETASNGVRSSRWTSNRRLSIELLCWQGVWCTHESRPKSATAPSSLNNSRDRTQLLQRSRRVSRRGTRGGRGWSSIFNVYPSFYSLRFPYVTKPRFQQLAECPAQWRQRQRRRQPAIGRTVD